MDIVVEKDGKRIAVEIETGKSEDVYNIRKALEAGFDEVVVIAVGDKLKREWDKFIERNAGFLKGKRIIVLNALILNSENEIDLRLMLYFLVFSEGILDFSIAFLICSDICEADRIPLLLRGLFGLHS